MIESLFSEGTVVLCLLLFVSGFILDLIVTAYFNLPRDQHRAVYLISFGWGVLLAGLIGHSLLIGGALGLLIPFLLLRQRMWCLIVYTLGGHIYLAYAFTLYASNVFNERDKLSFVLLCLLSLFVGLWGLIKIDSRGNLTISRALFVQLRSVLLGALVGVMFGRTVDSLWLWAAFGAALQLNLITTGILRLLQTGRA
ncbi:MAG: hypothetical protein K2W82_17260 [Candidatus Obscuribacterales bacterium]|jgi:hypothetical protein|nr:hypothetical protein [Candidatus Obscuribacterales bacterium]